MYAGNFISMFTPSLDGAMKRADTIQALHSITQTDERLPLRAKSLAVVLLRESKLASRTINAELLVRLGADWYERKIRRAFHDLIECGYGTRKPGANTNGRAGYLPPLWIWYTDNVDYVKCPPVVSSTSDDTEPLQMCKQTYWQAMRQEAKDMENGELKENIYFSIYMQNLEKARASKRGRFWKIIEDVLTQEAQQRDAMPPAVILRRMRSAHVQSSAIVSQEELEDYCKEWVESHQV
jgi:hypothetical protein